MECEEHFDELVRSEDQVIACPSCETTNVLKQLSAFAVHGAAAKPSFGGAAAGAAAAPAAATERTAPAKPGAEIGERLQPGLARVPPPPRLDWPDGLRVPCRRARRVRRRDRRLRALLPRRHARAGRLRCRRPGRRADARRRGTRLPRRPGRRAVRRPDGRPARPAAAGNRPRARRGLPRERPQVPPAAESRSARSGDRRLRAAPLPADRAGPAPGRCHSGQLRDEAPLRPPLRDHEGARPAARGHARFGHGRPLPALSPRRGAVHAVDAAGAGGGLRAHPGAAREAGSRAVRGPRRGLLPEPEPVPEPQPVERAEPARGAVQLGLF